MPIDKMYTDTFIVHNIHAMIIDKHAELRCADYWKKNTYIGKCLGDKAINCASLLRINTLFHFLISTFGLHYIKMDGKWDLQRKSVLDFLTCIL